MGIQYKRAWMLLDSMNRAFKEPLVTSIIGGAYAGAVLTSFGADVLDRYRRIAAAAETAGGERSRRPRKGRSTGR
jgi:molybdate transport system regulatory protein